MDASARDRNCHQGFAYEHPDDEFEDDSELGEDVDIDETGNVLHNTKVPPLTSTFGQSSPGYPDVVAHILAGYGTDICEQLIGEFLKLRLNHTNLSSLGDDDLERLGIRDAAVRSKMLADFALLPGHTYRKVELVAYTNANDYNAEALANIVKHMSDLKASISTILVAMCQKPSDNVPLDEQRCASSLILSTLDEFYRTVTLMEAKVLALQYRKPRNALATRSKPSTIWKHVFWLGLVGVSSAFLIKFVRPALLMQ